MAVSARRATTKSNTLAAANGRRRVADARGIRTRGPIAHPRRPLTTLKATGEDALTAALKGLLKEAVESTVKDVLSAQTTDAASSVPAPAGAAEASATTAAADEGDNGAAGVSTSSDVAGGDGDGVGSALAILEAEHSAATREIAELQVELERRKLQALQVETMEEKLRHIEAVSASKEEELLAMLRDKESSIRSLEEIVREQEEFVASVRAIEVNYATQQMASEESEHVAILKADLIEKDIAVAELQAAKAELEARVQQIEAAANEAGVEAAAGDEAFLAELDARATEKALEEKEREIETLKAIVREQEKITADMRALEIASARDDRINGAMGGDGAWGGQLTDARFEIEELKAALVEAKANSAAATADAAAAGGGAGENAAPPTPLAPIAHPSPPSEPEPERELALMSRIRGLEAELAEASAVELPDLDAMYGDLTDARFEIEKLKAALAEAHTAAREAEEAAKAANAGNGGAAKRSPGGRIPSPGIGAGARANAGAQGFRRPNAGAFILRKKIFRSQVHGIKASQSVGAGAGAGVGVGVGAGAFRRPDPGAFVLRKRIFKASPSSGSGSGSGFGSGSGEGEEVAREPKGRTLRRGPGAFVLKKRLFKRMFRRGPGAFQLRKRIFNTTRSSGASEGRAGSEGSVGGAFQRSPKGSYVLRKRVFASKKNVRGKDASKGETTFKF